MMKRNRTLIMVGLILAVLMAMVYLSYNQDDYYRRTLLPQDYTDGTTDILFFEKGTYTVTFNYAYTPDTQLQIVRGLTADGNNQLPMVLMTVPLSEAGQSVVTLAFDQTVYDIRFVYPADAELGFTDILSVAPVWCDTSLTLLLIAGVALYALLFFLRERKRGPEGAIRETGFSETTIRLLFIAVAVFATLPLMRGFFVNGHDLAFHLMRIEALKDGLLDGQFPVRIGPSFLGGLGYASSVMYPDLFLYLPAVFRLCGASIMVSYQAFVFLINLATLLVTCHAVKKLTGRATVGLIAGLVYTLGVNRLITLYTRAAVGEALALLFFPCVMLGMAEALHGGKVSKWLIVGMTGLIQSHVISVEIAAIACALYTGIAVILKKTTLQNLLRLLYAAGITVLLNLWFLVPFFRFSLEDLRMFNYTTRTALHAVYPAQWFASFVNPFGNASYLGTTAEMPLSVGLLPGIGILLYLLQNRQDDRRLRGVGRVSLGFGLLALITSSTIFPWTYIARIPVLGELLFAVQFPWRYLGIAGFFLSLVFAVSACGIVRDNRRLLIAACLVLAVFNAAPFLDQYVQAENTVYVMREKYDVEAMTEYSTWDYLYADTDFDTLTLPMAIAAPDGVAVSAFSKRGTHVTFSYAADTEQTVTLPLYLYPGYEATLNGTQALTPLRGDNHLMALSLPAGQGTVSVHYAGFWYYTVANLVSLGAALALLAWVFYRRFGRRKPMGGAAA